MMVTNYVVNCDRCETLPSQRSVVRITKRRSQNLFRDCYKTNFTMQSLCSLLFYALADRVNCLAYASVRICDVGLLWLDALTDHH